MRQCPNCHGERLTFWRNPQLRTAKWSCETCAAEYDVPFYAKGQTALQSFIESCLNVGSGFLLAWAVWKWLVAPLIATDVLKYDDAFIMTCIFTVVSLTRSFIWRRLANWYHHTRKS